MDGKQTYSPPPVGPAPEPADTDLRAELAALVNSPTAKYRIAFIHPDLGIGGAERLMVDAALGLQSLGHDVTMYTSYHDKSHCFEPTRDGTLDYNALSSLPPVEAYDLIFIDQIPAAIPLLRHLSGARVVYYCHFPDKEIGNSIALQRARDRGQSGPSVLRKLYRIPFDFYEETTTDSADKILVNSSFTQRQFIASFYRLRRLPRVLYPGIDVTQYRPEAVAKGIASLTPTTEVQKMILSIATQNSGRPSFLSINRFEAKKNVALAVDTFAGLRQQVENEEGETAAKKLRLILAGGYDHRVLDNQLTLTELQKQCDKLKLPFVTLRYAYQIAESAEQPSIPSDEEVNNAQIFFLPSVPGPLLPALLRQPDMKALLYTPTNEHFGIVPVEAMAAALPVVSTNTGGPVESIVDATVFLESGQEPVGTGLLRPANKVLWVAAAYQMYLLAPEKRQAIVDAGERRARLIFSDERMKLSLDSVMRETAARGCVKSEEGLIPLAATFIMGLAAYSAFVVLAFINGRLDFFPYVADVREYLQN